MSNPKWPLKWVTEFRCLHKSTSIINVIPDRTTTNPVRVIAIRPGPKHNNTPPVWEPVLRQYEGDGGQVGGEVGFGRGMSLTSWRRTGSFPTNRLDDIRLICTELLIGGHSAGTSTLHRH